MLLPLVLSFLEEFDFIFVIFSLFITYPVEKIVGFYSAQF